MSPSFACAVTAATAPGPVAQIVSGSTVNPAAVMAPASTTTTSSAPSTGGAVPATVNVIAGAPCRDNPSSSPGWRFSTEDRTSAGIFGPGPAGSGGSWGSGVSASRRR